MSKSIRQDQRPSGTEPDHNPFAEYGTHLNAANVIDAFDGATTILEPQTELRLTRKRSKRLASDLGFVAPGTGGQTAIAGRISRRDVERAVAQMVRAHQEAKK